ncbi:MULTISPECIES: substrate-binding domain-containing protein [Acidobacteriaceae]|uniref:substrate-binding domain-containing protein n=1 Tax=Acidobacteriaceae TaxID=204434 RepID=UPI00131E43BB|nr:MULTISPECIES: substrate-binding domain-containing protein [Acidobacteriaceae]MDW5267364.1 substrate-binding domain-containing protein [Edaphobacter sp.]
MRVRNTIRAIAIGLLGGLCGFSVALLPMVRVAPNSPTIAFIPRTSGTNFTEAMHRGAQQAARDAGYHLYWNASTREDDVDRQILLASTAVEKGAKAIILGPTNDLALITTINQFVSRKIPTVIVQADLPMPSGPYLTSVSPDQIEFGRLAANRIADKIGGTGEVAIIGLDRGAPETTSRSRSFIEVMAGHPNVKVVIRQRGSSQIQEAEQNAREILDAFPRIKAIFAVSASATEGTILALQQLGGTRAITLVGCDRDLFLADDLSLGSIDSLVVSDGYQIGYLAAKAAIAGVKGEPLPRPQHVKAMLLTRNNMQNYNFR